MHHKHGNFSASFISCPFAHLRPSHTVPPQLATPKTHSAHIRKKKKTTDELPTPAGLGSCEGLRPHVLFSSSGKALERQCKSSNQGNSDPSSAILADILLCRPLRSSKCHEETYLKGRDNKLAKTGKKAFQTRCQSSKKKIFFLLIL